MYTRGSLSKTSCYTSIKTRIETRSPARSPAAKPKPLATLPSKQGLKLVFALIGILGFYASCYTSIKTRIETQMTTRSRSRLPSSCYTSIKTRIETICPQCRISAEGQPLATLPSKQGLKPDNACVARCIFLPPLATLPSKQGLKLRRWSQSRRRVRPLATLPSKQGLKHKATSNSQRYL